MNESDKSDFKEKLAYRNQLQNIIDKITVEKTSPEIGTFMYVLDKYGGEYLRILNKNDNTIHIINGEDSGLLSPDRLKFYFMTYEEFYSEIERIGYTPWF
jgi:hypothetical protein